MEKTMRGLPQLTRWGPVDGKPPGIIVEDESHQDYVPWDELKSEVEERLLHQVDVVPRGSSISLATLRGKSNWVVEVLDPEGKVMGNLWFGPNPDEKWQWDGLVRLGDVEPDSSAHSPVWQVFQRYSDGSYRRIEAKVIDSLPAKKAKVGFPRKK